MSTQPRREFIGRALAQARYPNRPVALIVPFAPGGIADIVARTVSQAMGESLGQSFVVDNRPSAGGIVAGQAVAKAAPDGYTLMVMSNANAVSTGLFKSMAGIDALVVPYKGSPAVLTALRAGEIDLAFEILGPTLGQIASGEVRAIAVTGDGRNPALPEVPTVIEGGVPRYDVASWHALAAPAGTPPDVIERLARAAQEAIASPAVAARLRLLGVRPQAGSPAQLQSLLASEIRRWRDVIVAAKIEPA